MATKKNSKKEYTSIISGKDWMKQQEEEEQKKKSSTLMTGEQYKQLLARNAFGTRDYHAPQSAGGNPLNMFLQQVKEKNQAAQLAAQMQQEQEQYNQYRDKLAGYENTDKVVRGDIDLGKWTGDVTNEYKEAVKLGNAKNFRTNLNELIENKAYDQDSDMSLWSPDKRRSERQVYIYETQRQQAEIDRLNRLLEKTEKPAQASLWETAMKASSPDGFIPRTYANKDELAVDMALGNDEYSELMKQKRTAEAKMQVAKDNLEQLDRLDQKDADYQQLMAGVEKGDTVYHKAENLTNPERAVDMVYNTVNGGLYSDDENVFKNEYMESTMMLPEELDKFNSLYNAGRKDEAWAFYEGLQPYLNQAYNYFETLSIESNARRYPISSSLVSAAATVMQPVEYLANLPGRLEAIITGKENAATDPYSGMYSLTRLKSNIRNQVTRDLDDWGWVYSGLMSGVDSAINVALARGIGLPANMLQAGTLGLFYTQAFETSLQNTMAQGNDSFGYDYIEAWVDAAIETATEIWSVENWLADPKNLLTYVGKIAISEPSEEIVGAIVEPYIKSMIGHKDQYKERAKQILVDGGYTDGSGNWIEVKDMDAATRQAMREWNHDIRMAAQEALVSVGPSIAVGAGRIAYQNRQIGQAINSNNVNGEADATRKLAEAAAKMTGTDAEKGAKKILKQLEAKGKAKSVTVGQLTQDVLRESGEKVDQATQDARRDQIRQDLTALGVEESNAQRLAESIEEALEKGGLDKLSKAQRDAINGSQAAANTLINYQQQYAKHAEAKATAIEKEKASVNARSVAMNLMASRNTKDAAYTGRNVAEEEEYKSAKGTEVKGSRGVIIYNDNETEHGKLIGLKMQDGKLQYEVQTESGTKYVTADRIRSRNLGTAAIIEAQTNNPRFYSTGYVNQLLQETELNEKINPGTLMRDAMIIRLNAYMEQELPQTQLPAEVVQRLYDYSSAEHRMNRAEQTTAEKRNAHKAGEGKARYKGAEIGTKAFDRAIENLSEEDKELVRAFGRMAVQAGWDIDFIDLDDIENSTDSTLQEFKGAGEQLYGSENKKGITLNLGGQNFRFNSETMQPEKTGVKHHIGIALGHESIHWLQRNTMDGYDNLARYVLSEQKAKLGTAGLREEILNYMRSQNLGLEDAISELVADAGDGIFNNKEVINHIQQTNKTLYGQLKQFVKDMVQRVMKVMRGNQTSMSEAGRRMSEQAMRRVAELYNIAWDEAVGNPAQETRTAEEDTGRNSRAVYTYENLISKPDMTIYRAAELTDQDYESDSKLNQNEFAHEMMELAIQNNKGSSSVYNNDTQKDIILSTKSFKHSRGRALRKNYDIICRNIVPMLQNAVAVNESNEREGSNYSTWLISAIETKDSFIAARFNVENRTSKLGDFDVLYAISKSEMKKEGPVLKTRQFAADGPVLASPSFKISIAKLLDIVKNSKDMATVFSTDIANGVGISRPYDKIITPNLRYSRAQLDNEYMAALENGDKETQRRIVDESARRAGYIPVTRYHQTGERFTEFNTDNPVAGATDSETPNGIFLKDNDHDIGVGGDYVKTGRGGNIQMNVYLKYDNMLHFKNRQEAVAWYEKNIDGYKEARAEWDQIYNEKYKPQFDAIDKEMFDPNTTDDRYAELEEQEEKLIQELGEEEREHHKAMREILNDYFLNGKSKYDGIELDYDGHRYIDGKRENVHTYIVFSPSQVKSSDLVTYDNKGEVIKPSQRFDESKKDIRWSRAVVDQQYMQAVESGNEAQQQEMVKAAAQQNGYTDKAYHGTKMFGFTEFDLTAGRDTIFVSYGTKLAQSYTRTDEETRPISDRNGVPVNPYTMDEETLKKYALKAMPYIDGGKVLSIEADNDHLEEGYTVKYKDFWTGNEEESFFRTWEIQNAIEEWQNPNGEYDGIYELYTRPGNQLVVDADGHDWNDIQFDLYAWEDRGNDLIGEKWVPTDWSWDDEFDWADYEDGTIEMTATTRQIAKWAKTHGYDSVRINNLHDNGGRNWQVDYDDAVGDIGIFFNQGDVKSADNVVYDDNGDVVPLSERFDDTKTDIRWSRAMAEEQAEEKYGVDLNAEDRTASMLFSRASYERSEYYKNPEEMARMLAKNVLGSESKSNIAKARKWIKDVTSISAMIGERAELLDYIASPGRSSFKSNPEYGGSIDSSTICAKRLLQTGTIDAIQRAMPDYVMTAEDFLQIRRMMKERGYEVSCGLCFVESSRKNIAKYASQFMKEWNSQHPDNQVNMKQINTVLGLEDTRLNNKEVYEAYEKFMNKLAQRKPKLFEMRSEYNNDILKHFRNDESVAEKNKNGGMRINSFSDFEIVHLIDMMQVIMDMSNVGLAGQAYTKVRQFAEALGPTGLKINMSMIAKGVDENGRIIFDEIEGMKWDDVKDLRDKYADNVGTVCVVFTEDQLTAAMADDRIDFIIPFHRSQWNKSNYKDIGLPENTKDFTYWQNERYRTPVYGTKKDGSPKKLRASNYMPNEYWDFKKSGKENAEAYLKMCAENNKIPKFWKWLQANGDGTFSLKADGSTDGYWKLLIDFKMYNQITEKGAPQMPVRPEFDMEANERMLNEYKGGHNEFPIAQDVVDDFVKEKKQGRKGLQRGKGGRIQLAANEIDTDTRLSRYTPDSMDVQTWMRSATYSTFQTEDERALWEAYHRMRNSMDLSLKKQLEYEEIIKQLERRQDSLTTNEKSDLIAAKNRLNIEKEKYERMQDELFQITTGEGYANMMYRNNMILRDTIQGKTQEQVRQAVEDMLKLVQQTQDEIRKDTEDLKKLAQSQAVQTMKSFMDKSSASRMAGNLKKAYGSSMSANEIRSRLEEMVIKQAMGQDITADTETLAQDIVDKVRGIRSDTLESLRGQTLIIGQETLKQLKAENSNLKEIRSRLKGSGITIKTEQNSRLDEQWAELREKDQSLPDIDDVAADIDKLHTIVDFISGELEASRGANQFDIDMDEVAAMVRASVGNISTYISGDAAARAQINNLMKQIAELSKKTESTAADMENLEKQLDDVVLAGKKAKGWTTVMQRDMDSLLRYYNKTAKVAAQVEKNEVRKKLIETLKSQHTKELLEQQAKYREMMANDKKARELAADNQALRRKISTVTTRMANRIFAETDQKNVPEEAKALVRQVLDMMSAHDVFFRKVTYWDKQQVDNVRMRLQRMIASYGKFNPDTDLDFLVVKAPNPEDNDYTAQDKVIQDLVDIETGLMEYRTAEGQGRVTLQDRKNALTKVQEAISEIWNVVQARSEAEIAGRKWQIYELAEMMRDGMDESTFRGERTGRGSKTKNTLSELVNYGNLTPEYFFKRLKNAAMDLLHRGLKDAENRSGLEAMKARARVAQIAEEHDFSSWDGQEKHDVDVAGGRTITMTTEQIMALYATWQREHRQMRPEDTAHLLKGGFVLAQNRQDKGKPGRVKDETRPIRMTWNQLQKLGSYLTDEQKAYVDAMVQYMSGELAEIGNEASMKMYGIKKFTEKYYFPIKSWGGVLNSRSDAGVNSNNENRAAQQGFSKRIKNNASNAIEIGDFTPTAMKHIAGMINYNTVGPAIENLNKVLNQQLQYGEIKYTPDGEIDEDDTFKMNMRAAFKRAYGRQAYEYLQKFMKDMNGGVTQERTAFDKLLGLFKKNAVAGSLSVAAQQPLSYIRAAMMVNPKYLAQAILPQYWKGSYNEMMQHSGLAVIKEMGKFDMNFGQTMQEWITPEGMKTKWQQAKDRATEIATSGPQKMDAMTWTRMWSAVKLEQMAEHPGMDYSSDEFMDMVAERFNDLMRKTQVYDSVMTKSQNMRSNNKYAKTLTSFMAEPTLSLNVLEDAWADRKQKGGVKKVAKALATFALSAAAQAGAKAFFGTGRSPKKDKNKEENFYSKFWYNLLGEANPLGLIPGYRQMISLMEDGEITDDALGMIGKAKDALENIYKMATEWNWSYRNIEDSIGQLIQLTTDIPAKNFMRDFRAMVNFFSNGAAVDFTGDTYQQRETNRNMLKYDWFDTLMNNDLIGVINKELGDAGYKTTNAAYYQRIYDAEKAGNTKAAEEMKDYMIAKSTAKDPEKAMRDALNKLAKADEDLTGEEKVQELLDNGTSVTSIKTWIKTNYKAQYIAADTEGRRKLMNELTKMYKLIGVDGTAAMKIVSNWVKDANKKKD